MHCVDAVCSFACTAQDRWTNVERVVAVGDLHGDYGQYIEVLSQNKLIDEKLNWRGGKTHLVQLGDITDRGPDSLKIIKHLMRLEKQAPKKGGRVHVLTGNHEAMNIEGDLRYVHPGEYSTLITKKSKMEQDRHVEAVFAWRLASDPSLADKKAETLDEIYQEIPLGYVEHRLLWQPGQKIAQWAAGHNAVIVIDRTLFVHGGINPHQKLLTLEEINREISKELSMRNEGEVLSNSEDGPLWYRGLAENSADVELEPLKLMLRHYDVDRIVIAHTPTIGGVVTRFDGLVVLIDVGLSHHYGAQMANLIIDQGKLYAMHRGTRIALPGDAGLIEYLQQISDLEPSGSRLVKNVKSLGKNLLDDPE